MKISLNQFEIHSFQVLFDGWDGGRQGEHSGNLFANTNYYYYFFSV